jgi:simple sugar transport system permease protein
MSSPVATPPSPPSPPSTSAKGTEPVRVQRSLVARVLARPEIGALAAAIAIFVFFFAVAPPFRTAEALSTVLYASSTIGIVAVGVALLMIGGEFDLSSGVAVTTSALASAMISYQFSLNVWVGVLVSLLISLAIGFVNGYLLVRTKLPSFLITLSTFFVLQGLNLGVTKLVTGTVATTNVSDLDGFASAKAIFAGDIPLGFMNVKMSVLWWLLFVLFATWLLLRTRTGNWIFASGGNQDSARAVGVPVAKVKIGLFMGVGLMAWFLGQHLLFNFSTVQAGLGVGSALGAFIFGMTTQGIVYAGWDPNWFKTFLGAMLLLAVLVNLYVKNYASTRK